MLVEEAALVDEQFAADNLVARGGVSAEVDAPDVILLAFVELHGHVDALGSFVDFGIRLRNEIDETVLPVNLGVVLHRFTDFGGVKNVALLQRKNILERVGFQGEGLVRIGADDLDGAHRVAFALFDGDGDVDGFAGRAPGNDRNAPAPAGGVHIFENGIVDDDAEVAVVLIQAANTDFDVFDQFVVVVGLGHHVDFGDVQRNRVRSVVAHGANDLAIAERLI